MGFSKVAVLIVITTIFLALLSPKLALGQNLPDSTISAAPALLPADPPASSPPPAALSPDITPLFPSPGGPELSPSESSLPIIPSSPSPPNPDAMEAPGPVMAFAPSGLLPDSSSIRLNMSRLLSSMVVLHLVVFLSTNAALW